MKKKKFFYIYVLRSLKDKKIYIGKTQDLRRRLKEHNAGKVKSTKNRRPFELVYYEAYTNKDKWSQQELFYKTGIGRENLKHKL